jgi:hypothetical protein
MKKGTMVVVNTKARRIAFVMVCLLMASFGLAAKVTLNGLNRTQDNMLRDFMLPSQAFLQGVSDRQKAGVAVVKTASKQAVKEVASPAVPVE